MAMKIVRVTQTKKKNENVNGNANGFLFGDFEEAEERRESERQRLQQLYPIITSANSNINVHHRNTRAQIPVDY